MSLAPEWVASHSNSNTTSEAWTTTGGKKLLMKNHRGLILDKKKSIELKDNYSMSNLALNPKPSKIIFINPNPEHRGSCVTFASEHSELGIITCLHQSARTSFRR
jgi:hypothetical protein